MYYWRSFFLFSQLFRSFSRRTNVAFVETILRDNEIRPICSFFGARRSYWTIVFNYFVGWMFGWLVVLYVTKVTFSLYGRILIILSASDFSSMLFLYFNLDLLVLNEFTRLAIDLVEVHLFKFAYLSSHAPHLHLFNRITRRNANTHL